MPPEVMQKLVETLSSHPERIERCVIQMPIMCLDFNQVAKLCIHNNLHTAFAYLYNEGLKDVLTPATEMIRGILTCETPESQLNLTRKLCVYVAYCFRGMRYPPADKLSTLVMMGQTSISNDESETITKTPLLGDIPILGRLFKSTAGNNSKSELIILVTPKIIDDSYPNDSNIKGIGINNTSENSRRILEEKL